MNEHAVPLDMRALRALKASPFELDWYCFLTYRFYSLSRPTLLTWGQLHSQFGTETQSQRKFRHMTRHALKNVHQVYRDANFEITDKGVLLRPSNTSVRRLIASW
jgi:hypothetical protein